MPMFAMRKWVPKNQKQMWDKRWGFIDILQRGILDDIWRFCWIYETAMPLEHHRFWMHFLPNRGGFFFSPSKLGASPAAGNVVNWPKRRWIDDENTGLPVAASLRKMAHGWKGAKGAGDLGGYLKATGTVPKHKVPNYKDIKMPSTE